MSMKETVLGWYNKYRIKVQEIDKIAEVAEDRKERVRDAVEAYEKTQKNINKELDKEKENYVQYVQNMLERVYDEIGENVDKCNLDMCIELILFKSRHMEYKDCKTFSRKIIENTIVSPLINNKYSVETYLHTEDYDRRSIRVVIRWDIHRARKQEIGWY